MMNQATLQAGLSNQTSETSRHKQKKEVTNNIKYN